MEIEKEHAHLQKARHLSCRQRQGTAREIIRDQRRNKRLRCEKYTEVCPCEVEEGHDASARAQWDIGRYNISHDEYSTIRESNVSPTNGRAVSTRLTINEIHELEHAFRCTEAING